MNFSAEVLDQLAQSLTDAGYLVSPRDFRELVQKIDGQARGLRAGKGSNYGENSFSISRAIRGLAGMEGKTVVAASRDEDISYAQKTLVTGTTPGSYLVPTIQASDIIQLLTSANAFRQAGARVWPMSGIQKLNVPIATAAPTIVWGDSSGTGPGGQGVTLTPSDPNIGQVAFDLKSQKSLTAIPNELLAVSLPAVDQIITEILGLAFAQDEMNKMVQTAAGTGQPTPAYAAAGTSTLNANNNNANGGAVNYKDLLATVGKFYTQKGKGNPAWFMHPTVFYADVMGILDTTNRPIITGQDNVEQAFMGKLLGFPVYVSAEFPVNQVVGSGSGQSYAIFTNPSYINLGTPGGIEIAVSTERFFDSNQVAVRGVNKIDFAFAPAAAVVLLKGINV
jgi:HK97 family phage major capsid protein